MRRTSSVGVLFLFICGSACARQQDRAGQQALTIVPLSSAEDAALDLPIDVAADTGNLFVVDEEFPSVRVLSNEGEATRSFGVRGAGPGEMGKVTGIAIAGDDVAIGDGENGRVSVFKRSAEFRHAFSMDGSFGSLSFDSQGLLHIDRGGSLVSDAAGSGATVEVYNLDGRLLRRYGRFVRPADEKGSGLHNRARLAADPFGGMWVLYTYRAEALYFDSAGRQQRSLRVPTPKDWSANAPYVLAAKDGMSYVVVRPTVADDIAVDSTGRVYVLVSLGVGSGDDARSVLHVYTRSGELQSSSVLPARYRAIELHRGRLLLLRYVRLNEPSQIDVAPVTR